MYLCYIDESGTSSIPGNTSHFVLSGISVPIWHWKDCDRAVSQIKKKFHLEGAEIHTGWLIRPYLEQSRIQDFEKLSYSARRSAVEQSRRAEILRLQKAGSPARYKQVKKNYKQTEHYIHLSLTERRQFVKEIAESISCWGFARLFAECIDKVHFDPARHQYSLDETAFDQIVSRFEKYLKQIPVAANQKKSYGLLIHDNNETVAKKHTLLMTHFHKNGTLWTNVENIIETPLFVDSQLTSMIQIADVCAYALRRYLENGEEELFDLVFKRADRRGAVAVGVRHFTSKTCGCKICSSHKTNGHC